MGAEWERQERSNAVSYALATPLTWAYVPHQSPIWRMDLVRIEGVRGSNPLSSTSRSEALSETPGKASSMPEQQQGRDRSLPGRAIIERASAIGRPPRAVPVTVIPRAG